jgi:hypothetical protein
MVINPDVEQHKEASIFVRNFEAEPALTIWTLSGRSPYSFEEKEVSFRTETKRMDEKAVFAFSPHSVTKINWHKKSSGRAERRP